MFEQLFSFTEANIDALSWQSVVLTIAIAFVLGIFISLAYMKTHPTGLYQQSFVLTLVMLPVIVAIIIFLIGSNVARAFSLAGAFSLIRFRSSMGDPKDIAYVFFAMAVGLALGVGFAVYAVLFAAILCFFMLFLSRVNFGARKRELKRLRILVPEDLDYTGAFDDVFSEFTDTFRLIRVKTVDMGSLYELQYSVLPKPGRSEKEFIDRLRCRNGNLTIILSVQENEE